MIDIDALTFLITVYFSIEDLLIVMVVLFTFFLLDLGVVWDYIVLEIGCYVYVEWTLYVVNISLFVLFILLVISIIFNLFIQLLWLWLLFICVYFIFILFCNFNLIWCLFLPILRFLWAFKNFINPFCRFKLFVTLLQISILLQLIWSTFHNKLIQLIDHNWVESPSRLVGEKLHWFTKWYSIA